MAELALTVGLKGRDDLSRPLDRAAKAARGLRGRLRGTGDGLDRTARSAKAMGQGARALSAPMAQAARKVRELERGAGDIDRFRSLKTAAHANAKALEAAKAKTQALGRAMATGEGRTAKTAAAFKKARKDLAALEAKTRDSTRAVAVQRAKLKAAGISTRDLASAQRGLARELVQARQAAEDQARALARAARRAERLAGMKDRLRGLAGALGKAAGAARGLAGRAAAIAGPLGVLGGAASLAGLGRLVTGFASASDEISKFARQTGFTAEAIQELQYAADRQGVSQSTFNAALGAFSKRLGELKAGKGALAGLLKDADPALAAQLAGADSAEQAFGTMMTALEAIQDPQRRAALAAAAFSRSGMVMTRVAEAGAEGLAALRADARALGLVVRNDTAAAAEGFVDSMTRFQAATAGLGKTVSARLMPVLKPLIDGLTRWIVANREIVAARVEAVVRRIAAALAAVDFERLRQGFVRVVATVATAVEAIGGWKTALIGGAAVMAAGPIAAVARLAGGLLSLAGGALPLLAAGLKALAATVLPLVAVGVKALTAAVIANPIGAAVAVIAGAAALIVANWEPIAAWFAGLWQRIREPLATARDWIKTAFGWTPLGLIIANWEPIATWFSGLWQRILAPFRDAMAFIQDKLGFLSGAVGKAAGLFAGLFGSGDGDTGDRGGSNAPAGPQSPRPSSRRREPFPAPVPAGTARHPAAAPSGPPPAFGPQPAPAAGRVVHRTVNLTVTPPPGADPREVARLVMEALERAGHDTGADGRGRLHDSED